MTNYPQQVLNWIFDVIFPKVCLGCGKFTGIRKARLRPATSGNPNTPIRIADFDYVCRKCFREIRLKSNLECIGCKKQTHLGLTCARCTKGNRIDPEQSREDSSRRASAPYGIDQLIIAAELSDPLVEKMLKIYKYSFILDMAAPLSAIAKKCIKKLASKKISLFEDNPLLIPVPLHKKRLNWRGFNQSQLIAQNISDSLLVSLGEGILVRNKDAKRQADIKVREERLQNIRGNFVITDYKIIKGRTVILVDDICTTGATLNECARVLKNPPAGGGVKKVIGFVIARG